MQGSLSSLVDSSSKVTYIFLTTNKKKEFWLLKHFKILILSSLAWVYNVYCFVFIPQNAQTTQKPTGLRFGIHRAYRRCASYDRRHRIDCLCSVAEVKHGSPPMAAQAIISVDSCLAKRRPFCGFEKLKARRLLCGLCVLWELHTKELQVKLYVHYTNIKMPTSTITSSLYHSKYRMNLKNRSVLVCWAI